MRDDMGLTRQAIIGAVNGSEASVGPLEPLLVVVSSKASAAHRTIPVEVGVTQIALIPCPPAQLSNDSIVDEDVATRFLIALGWRILAHP